MCGCGGSIHYDWVPLVGLMDERHTIDDEPNINTCSCMPNSFVDNPCRHGLPRISHHVTIYPSTAVRVSRPLASGSVHHSNLELWVSVSRVDNACVSPSCIEHLGYVRHQLPRQYVVLLLALL